MPRPRAGINQKDNHMSTTQTLNAAETREQPAAPAVKLPDPEREVRRERGINYEWEISNDGEAGRRLAVLSITHRAAGMSLSGRSQPNHFAATLRNQSEQKRPGGIVTRGFSLSCGQVVIAAEEVTRFSQKRQDTFAKAALETLRERYEQQHEDVLSYFRSQAQP
jgi:hypothetical protein